MDTSLEGPVMQLNTEPTEHDLCFLWPLKKGQTLYKQNRDPHDRFVMENLTKDLVNTTINYKNSQDILPDSEAAENVTL